MAGLATLVISTVMDEKQVSPQDIPDEGHRMVDADDLDSIKGSKRYFRVRGFAKFETHYGCRRTWKSAHAWAIMDLRRQTIVHSYKQECQHCEGDATPTFEEEALRRMAEWATEEYLHRSGRVRRNPYASNTRSIPDEYQSDKPHDQTRCQMCRKLGRPCWSGRHTSTSEYTDNAYLDDTGNVYLYDTSPFAAGGQNSMSQSAGNPQATTQRSTVSWNPPSTRIDHGPGYGQGSGLRVRTGSQPGSYYSTTTHRRNQGQGCCVLA